MRDPYLEARTAKTRSQLAVAGTVLLSLAGGALGLELGTIWSFFVGLLLPPGAVALYLAHRDPPTAPPSPSRPLKADP